MTRRILSFFILFTYMLFSFHENALACMKESHSDHEKKEHAVSHTSHEDDQKKFTNDTQTEIRELVFHCNGKVCNHKVIASSEADHMEQNLFKNPKSFYALEALIGYKNRIERPPSV